MFKHERSLLVRVALHTSSIRACVEPCLLHFESAVGVMAVAALHRPLEDSMMKRLCELAFHLVMAGHAQLRFRLYQHLRCGQVIRVCRKRTDGKERRRYAGLPPREPRKLFRHNPLVKCGVAISTS